MNASSPGYDSLARLGVSPLCAAGANAFVLLLAGRTVSSFGLRGLIRAPLSLFPLALAVFYLSLPRIVETR